MENLLILVVMANICDVSQFTAEEESGTFNPPVSQGVRGQPEQHSENLFQQKNYKDCDCNLYLLPNMQQNKNKTNKKTWFNSQYEKENVDKGLKEKKPSSSQRRLQCACLWSERSQYNHSSQEQII